MDWEEKADHHREMGKQMSSAQERYDYLCNLPLKELRELAKFSWPSYPNGSRAIAKGVLRAERGDAVELDQLEDPPAPTPKLKPGPSGSMAEHARYHNHKFDEPAPSTCPGCEPEREKFHAVIQALFPGSIVLTDPHVSNVAKWIVEDGLPEFVRRFMEKNADYGDQHATIGLGPKGEFVGPWRKIYKLRESLWREKPMLNEDTDEMLSDIIGTCLLIQHLMAIENGDEPQPLA